MPWHLTTQEFVRDIDRVLRPGGTYVLNLIDRPPLRFARAEAATLAGVFEHVAILGPADRLAGRTGGNFVLAAAHQPLTSRPSARTSPPGATPTIVLSGAEVTAFIAGQDRLTDDYAPVDQLLAPAQ